MENLESKSALTRCAVLLGCALGFSTGHLRATSLTPEQSAWLAKGWRSDRAGWIYVHIEGEPRERGFQYGYLVARETAAAMTADAAQWHNDSSFDWAWLVAKTKGFVEPGIDPEYRDELQGIVEGMAAAGVNTRYSDLVAYNAFIELDWYWWPIALRQMTGEMSMVNTPKEGCTSFIATGRMTKDGRIVLGHTTWCPYVLATSNVVLDLVPAKGHRILMQTWPGMIDSGTDFFLTDAGLVGSETTIDGFQLYSEKGVPEFVRMRRASQYADSIDAWCALVKTGNNGGLANAWLLGDIKTGEIARLELGLNHIGFERTRDGYFTGSNVPENLGILRFETNLNDGDIRNPDIARRVRWKELMRQNAGKIDASLAESMLADCYDTCLGQNRGSARTLAGHSESDPNPSGTETWDVPYYPIGAFDSKVTDATLAGRLTFFARWGSADGTAFDAPSFLAAHPQFDWMAGVLKSRPVEPWTSFTAGQR